MQGRSQDFVIGGLNGSGGGSLKNFKILNIGLRKFYVMFKCKSDTNNQLKLNEIIFFFYQ